MERSYQLNENVLNDTTFFNTYSVENDDWWENISYRQISSVYGWWTVAIINEVVDPFEELEDGKLLKILKKPYLYQMLKEVKNISRL